MFLILEIALLVLSAHIASALPSWSGGYGTRPQIAIGSLVPGASFVEALGHGISYEQYRPKYLSVNAETGLPGAAIIYENPSPPLFFITNQELWQVTNHTSMLRVNVMNVTVSDVHPAPLMLDLSEEADGVEGGVWRWRGTKLHYDLGTRSNDGLFFWCGADSIAPGVYMSLDPMPVPNGCKFTTLHSFVQRKSK